MAREFSPRQRYAALVLLAPIFLFLIPSIVVRLGTRLDQWLQWPPVPSPPSNLVVGCLLILPSWLFALWSIYSQFTIGRGTPVPIMATQQLVVQPPYTYCRNPMALGAIGMYLGVAILFRSVGAVVLVLLCAGALLTYVKRVEEAELEIRFGQEYLAYKRRTPFLLPRFSLKGVPPRGLRPSRATSGSDRVRARRPRSGNDSG
jgi:protein-S-isoprenylcysteine O-methyltransferase Ste14